jgi:hypothetical protein
VSVNLSNPLTTVEELEDRLSEIKAALARPLQAREHNQLRRHGLSPPAYRDGIVAQLLAGQPAHGHGVDLGSVMPALRLTALEARRRPGSGGKADSIPVPSLGRLAVPRSYAR